MKNIVRIFFIGLLGSCISEQLLQGRPGPGSGDYPAEPTGFVQDEEWDSAIGTDLDNRTFLNKWRTEQQKKLNPAPAISKKSTKTEKEMLRKQLLKDFERYIDALQPEAQPLPKTPALKNKRTPLHGSNQAKSGERTSKMQKDAVIATIKPTSSSSDKDKVVEIKTINQNENVIRGVVDETEEGSREL